MQNKLGELEALLTVRDQDIARLEAAHLEASIRPVNSGGDDGGVDPMELQRWEFLFAQANGDRMMLNDEVLLPNCSVYLCEQLIGQVDRLQLANGEMDQKNQQLQMMVDSAHTRIGLLCEHTSKLQETIAVSLPPDQTVVLKSAMSQLEARHSRLINSAAADQRALEQLEQRCEQFEHSSRQAELEAARLRLLTSHLQSTLAARPDPETAAPVLAALARRTEAAEDFAMKLQGETERLNSQLASSGAGEVDESRLAKNNAFLVKRIKTMEASVRRAQLDKTTFELVAEKRQLERMEELREELMACVDARISRAQERRASEYWSCCSCGQSELMSSHELNALTEMLSVVNQCFDSTDPEGLEPEQPVQVEQSRGPSAVLPPALQPSAQLPASNASNDTAQFWAALSSEAGTGSNTAQMSAPAEETRNEPAYESFAERIHREHTEKESTEEKQQKQLADKMQSERRLYKESAQTDLVPPPVDASAAATPVANDAEWAPAAVSSAKVQVLESVKPAHRKRSGRSRRQVVAIADAEQPSKH